MTPSPLCRRRSLVGTGWPSTNHPLLYPSGPSRVAPEAPAASNICLLLCNGILAAALLIRCMDLAEIFLNVPLSARTRLCSESATNLLIVR
ncbi:unnamed protein product [Staurois parvus]|uniref:Uncharacterized protein n=1 Tax=Staurois parvus TaxID=386267 RepID=A0ABN9H658_9NEOB|nr:unnamed protein product [Staurois parvus]